MPAAAREKYRQEKKPFQLQQLLAQLRAGLCVGGGNQKTQEEAVRPTVWILYVALRTASVDTDSFRT